MRKARANWARRIASLLIILTLVVVFAIPLLNAAYTQPWSGFNEALTEQKFSGLKTLWDWLQLLIIPVAIAGVGLWFNRSEKQNDRNIATEDRHERIVQTYFDKMAEHLLDKDVPLISADPEHVIRKLARARTLTALRALKGDVERKSSVIRFLYEAELIGSGNELVILRNADLSGLPLSKLNLANISLQEASLSGANLRSTNLNGADLGSSNLRMSDLSGSTLIKANLQGANLNGATLRGAKLSGANLQKTVLTNAHLEGADLTDAQLVGANVYKAHFERCSGITVEMIWETKLWQEAWFNEDFWRDLNRRRPKRATSTRDNNANIAQSQDHNNSTQKSD